MIAYRIKIILKRFFKNKLNYLVVFLIGLSFAFFILVNSLFYSANEYFKENVINYVSYRQFFVHTEDSEKQEILIKKLNSMSEVEGVFDHRAYMVPWKIKDFNDNTEDDNLANMILTGVEGEFKSDIGENLSSSSNDNAIVCPSTYYSDSDKTVKIDLKPYLGKYITLRYLNLDDSKEISVKLVGLYDNDKLKRDYRICHMNSSNLLEISKDFIDDYSGIVYYELKDINDENKVTDELRKNGFWPEPIIFGNRTLAIESLDLLLYASKGIFVISIFIVSCIMFYNFKNLKKYHKMQNIMGYSNDVLIVDYLIEMLLTFILSVISMSILSLLFLLLFQNIIPSLDEMFKYVKMVISPSVFCESVIYLFVISNLVSIINYLFGRKVE